MGIQPREGLPTKAQLTALGQAMMQARSTMANALSLLEMLEERESDTAIRTAIGRAAKDMEHTLKYWDRDE